MNELMGLQPIYHELFPLVAFAGFSTGKRRFRFFGLIEETQVITQDLDGRWSIYFAPSKHVFPCT